MKRLLFVILAFLLLCPAYAESGMLLPMGPYTYDAEGCLSFNYESENAVYVDYSWGYLYIEYIKFSSDWVTPEYFKAYYGAYNSWDIAEACIDMWYGEGNPAYTDTQIDDIDLQYFPACRFFTCTVSDEYGGGIMPCAVFADSNGILFLECMPYVSPDELPAVRSLVMSKLFFNGESVISPEAAEEAYAAREIDTKPAVIEFGDDFTYDTTGCITYTKAGDDFVTVIYGDCAVSIEYCTHNEIIYLPEELDRAMAAEDTHAQFAKICYTKYVVDSDIRKELKLEGISSDGEKGTLLYNCRSAEDNFAIAGAVCANHYGTLFIEVYHTYEEGWLENLQQLREDILENITCIILD